MFDMKFPEVPAIIKSLKQSSIGTECDMKSVNILANQIGYLDSDGMLLWALSAVSSKSY